MKPLQKSTFGRLGGLISAFTLCWLLSVCPVVSAQDAPLLMDGKSTLYQRVLTLPKAELWAQPGQQTGEVLVTFSRYYVYQRKNQNGQDWLLIGPDRFGKTVGWVDKADTVEWHTQLTLLLTNPANRQPLLFFDSAETLEPLIESEQGGQKVAELAKQLELQGAAKGVVSREPEYSVDFQNNFYLIPVLSAEERYLYDGNIGQLLQIASVSAKPDLEPAKAADPKPAQTEQRLLRGFSAAIVFVIDSTISMGPYIERTREAVKSIYEKIERENLLNNVKFGLVAYRSNLQASAKLEYVTRFFADPDEIKNSEDFLNHVAALKPATVSTARFDEDAFAGVMQALNEVTWTDFGGRYLVLITDAGALKADDPLSATRLSAKSVRLEAEYRGVALYTLHLKTPQGRKNHASAETQYTELSFNKILNKPLYHGVEAGNVQAFGDVVERLSEAMVGTVKQAYAGQTVAGSAATADPKFGRGQEDTGKAPEQAAEADQSDQLVADTRLLGHAMQLEYLGQQTGSQVPDAFKAWIVDRDLQTTSQKTVEARVLLSKSQLSDLSEVVQEIYQAASDSIIAPDTFFNRLSSLAATMGRDPNQLTESKSTKLVELGLLGEYLQDIPYRSDVMGLDAETWEAWSASQQDAFIRGLGNKLRYYRLYNQDVDRWISLAEGSDPRDHVYPVPLEALP